MVTAFFDRREHLGGKHVYQKMFFGDVSVSHHQTGLLFATCITGVCKFVVHECVYCADYTIRQCTGPCMQQCKCCNSS